MKIEFTIPGKPMGKGRPHFFGGRAVTPESTREYEEMTAMLARTAAKGKSFPPESALCVTIRAYYPIPKRTPQKTREQMLSGGIRPRIKPDADNVAKIVLDALNRVLYEDDAQAVALYTYKLYGEEPCVVVEVEGITE